MTSFIEVAIVAIALVICSVCCAWWVVWCEMRFISMASCASIVYCVMSAGAKGVGGCCGRAWVAGWVGRDVVG